jgi:hypothetical protein
MNNRIGFVNVATNECENKNEICSFSQMIGTKNTTNKTKNHKKNELQNKYFHQ